MYLLLEKGGVRPNDVTQGHEEDGSDGALLTSGEEGIGLRAIRNGMNLRKEDCGSFWDDFVTVCGDADGMADLLEVPREKIASWPSKVKEALEQVESSDSEDDGKKSELMSTDGNEGPSGDQEERGITYNAPDMRPTP